MRSGCALVLAVTACGGYVGPATPQDRGGPVHLVRCRPAPRLPALDTELAAFGRLVGGEAEAEVFGRRLSTLTMFGASGGGGGGGIGGGG
ncbi:MAG TPA: hypothetical protein VN253_16130, partial [Kofleriaceae bacterium]|nr:hypothetical protein [Kofleriaceae bacterium]